MKSKQDCFHIDESGNGERPEISLTQTETRGVADDQIILCGYTPIVLMKMFGPLIFADIRIRADYETCQWVIERRDIDSNKWREVVRISGQIEEEFKNEKNPNYN